MNPAASVDAQTLGDGCGLYVTLHKRIHTTFYFTSCLIVSSYILKIVSPTNLRFTAQPVGTGCRVCGKKTFAYSMDKQQDSITTLPAKQPEEQRSAEPEFQLGPPRKAEKNTTKTTKWSWYVKNCQMPLYTYKYINICTIVYICYYVDASVRLSIWFWSVTTVP